MRRLGLLALSLSLGVMPAAPAWAQAAPPSLGMAGARALGAASVVGLLLALTLLGLRWLFRRVDHSTDAARLRRVLSGRMSWFSRWVPAATAAADRLAILDRSYVGPKESICLVQVGPERFLIGVTASRISLLGRLEVAREAAEVAGEETGEPAAADFARELSGASVARPGQTDDSVRSLLARSRERLARLGVNSRHAGGWRA
jgi:flagellar biogenesis protein FliO